MSDREKNILDEGVRHLEPVIVKGLHGLVTGVDFRDQLVRIEIQVPAYLVKREVKAAEEALALLEKDLKKRP